MKLYSVPQYCSCVSDYSYRRLYGGVVFPPAFILPSRGLTRKDVFICINLISHLCPWKQTPKVATLTRKKCAENYTIRPDWKWSRIYIYVCVSVSVCVCVCVAAIAVEILRSCIKPSTLCYRRKLSSGSKLTYNITTYITNGYAIIRLNNKIFVRFG